MHATEEKHIPTLDVDCRGDARLCGEAIGESSADRIRGATEALSRYEAFRQLQPWWMPYSVYVWMAQSRARQALWQPVREVLPTSHDRLGGMATGARCPLDALYLFHALETASSYLVDQPATPLAGCTAVALGKKRSATGQPILHHNFDQIPLARPSFVIRRRRETDCYDSLEFSLAPLAGAIDGINEHGLAITYNFAWTTDAGPPAPPVSMAISEALGRCRNVPEAMKLLRSGISCGGCLLMLGDAEGNIARLELAGRHACVKKPRRRGLLFHSNTYRSWRMKPWEVSRRARYLDGAPTALRGKRVLESPKRRDVRLSRLLKNHTQLDADDLVQVMSDHGHDDQPDENTICMHGDYWTTLATVQLLPAERALRISYESACCAKFETFAL